jgi:hypothetical protein
MQRHPPHRLRLVIPVATRPRSRASATSRIAGIFLSWEKIARIVSRKKMVCLRGILAES